MAATVKIEGIWNRTGFGGWRVLFGEQCIGVFQEIGAAESEVARLRKASRNLI